MTGYHQCLAPLNLIEQFGELGFGLRGLNMFHMI
jgi:hypothetical protein